MTLMMNESNLNLKQCQADIWSTREQLCLASAVMRSGDQNWAAVSRTLRLLSTETDRPPDWYSTKNCAIQYGKLLEQVDTPKRKRERNESNETPEQSVTKMLTKQRIEELHGILEEEKTTYNQLYKEVALLETGQLDHCLNRLWDEIIQEQKKEDEEKEKQEQWLKDRQQKILAIQNALKLSSKGSPFKRTYPGKIELLSSTSSDYQETNKNKGFSITFDNSDQDSLEEKPSKSVLSLVACPSTTNSKSEGSSAFSQSDSTSNEATKVHLKEPTKSFEELKNKSSNDTIQPQGISLSPVKKEKEEVPSSPDIETKLTSPRDHKLLTQKNEQFETIVETSSGVQESKSQNDDDKRNLKFLLNSKENKSYSEGTVSTSTTSNYPKGDIKDNKSNVKSAFDELLSSHNASANIKYHSNLNDSKDVKMIKKNEANASSSPSVSKKDTLKVAAIKPESSQESPKVKQESESSVACAHSSGSNKAQTQSEPRAQSKDKTTCYTPSKSCFESPDEVFEFKDLDKSFTGFNDGEDAFSLRQREKNKIEFKHESSDDQKKKETETPRSYMKESKDHLCQTPKAEPIEPLIKVADVTEGDGSTLAPKDDKELLVKSIAKEIKNEKDWDENEEDKKTAKSSYSSSSRDAFDEEASRDSLEVKDILGRGDRRKPSASEGVASPVISDGTPSSPASTNYGDDPEGEKAHRSWKRSIMNVWNDIAAHKHASIFLRPITEDKVPGYRSVVRRPSDLVTVKRQIEMGIIRTTPEFQRDILLMFLNAKMYNTRDHDIFKLAQEMMLDVNIVIEEFVNTHLLSRVLDTPQKSLRRETRESSSKRIDGDKRKRDTEEREKGPKRRK